MPTFGARIKCAMLVKGDASAAKLAEVGGFSLVTARAWFRRKECSEETKALFKIAVHTGARLQWIITGNGPIRSLRSLNSMELRAAEILDRLPRDQLESWLSQAESLLSRER